MSKVQIPNDILAILEGKDCGSEASDRYEQALRVALEQGLAPEIIREMILGFDFEHIRPSVFSLFETLPADCWLLTAIHLVRLSFWRTGFLCQVDSLSFLVRATVEFFGTRKKSELLNALIFSVITPGEADMARDPEQSIMVYRWILKALRDVSDSSVGNTCFVKKAIDKALRTALEKAGFYFARVQRVSHRGSVRFLAIIKRDSCEVLFIQPFGSGSRGDIIAEGTEIIVFYDFAEGGTKKCIEVSDQYLHPVFPPSPQMVAEAIRNHNCF